MDALFRTISRHLLREAPPEASCMYVCMYVCVQVMFACVCGGGASAGASEERKPKKQLNTGQQWNLRPNISMSQRWLAAAPYSPLLFSFALNLSFLASSLTSRLTGEKRHFQTHYGVPDYLETVLLRQLLTLAVSRIGSTGCRKAIGPAPSRHWWHWARAHLAKIVDANPVLHVSVDILTTETLIDKSLTRC